MRTTKDFLLDVPIPGATESYSPVSHANIFNAAYEQLDRYNLVVEKETFHTNRDGKKVIANLDIIHPDVPHLGMRLSLRNSYDKSMSVGFASGAVVWICGNGMVSGEVKFVRKHTGNVVKEVKEKIIYAIEDLDTHFQRVLSHSEQLNNIEMTKEQYAELIGRLFIIDKVVTPTQLGIISREIDKPTFTEFESQNAWSLYNHVTFSLKEAHPYEYLSRHIELHNFMEREFSLTR